MNSERKPSTDGQKEIKKLKENIKDLYNLADDEKTEEAMLLSRIEEQSSLIMMLKKRADDYIIRAQVLDKDNKELMEKNTVLTDQIRKDDKKYRIIQQNFNRISQSYDELQLEFEKLKSLNDDLELEKEDFEREMLALKAARKNSEVSVKFKKENDKLISTNKELLENIDILKSQHENELARTYKKLIEKDQRIEDLQQQLKQIESQSIHNNENQLRDMENLRTINSQWETKFANISQNCEVQASIIKKQQIELENLLRKNKQTELQFESIKEKYKRESEDFNANTKIKSLQTELDEEKNKVKQFKEEFQAFKAHSNKLLQTEKELNSRLRKLYA